MTRAGFTLIEVLAVVVLLSLAAGLGGLTLSTAGEVARFREADASTRDLDQRARLYARAAGEPVSLALDAAAGEIVSHSVRTGEVLGRVRLPPGVAATLSDAGGTPSASVSIDTRGHGADYRVALVGPNGNTVLTFAGLTGWCQTGSGEGRP